MPSAPADPASGTQGRAAPLRLCIFGDSHIACIRAALGARETYGGAEIDFWGTAGTRFRMIAWDGERLRPEDEFTARRFAAVSRTDRRTLGPGDYDAILFMGVRTRVQRVFAELMHRARTPAGFLSRGVQREMIRADLQGKWIYPVARGFAAAGRARILYAPVSFPTAGVSRDFLDRFPAAAEGTAAERAAIWALYREIMAEDGITLIDQPERTVIQGCLTESRYAAAKVIARGDATHKNAAYGALVLRRALRFLEREGPVAAMPGGTSDAVPGAEKDQG